MIIVDCATFNAMNRDYMRWCHLYSEPAGKTETREAVKSLLESLGTIINECQIDNDAAYDDDGQPDDVKEHEDFAGDNDASQWEIDE